MIALFGGSFDPIHHGHLIVGQTIVELLDVAGLRFMPAREQPLKRGRHAAAAEHRARMVSLAIAGEPRFALETLELEHAGPSYTVETLRVLRQREPHERFLLLLGSDAAAELHSWREPEAIQELAEIAVFTRPGSKLPEGQHLGRIVEVPALDISATVVRQRVRQGLSIRYWVPDAVADYIAAHGLYLNGE